MKNKIGDKVISDLTSEECIIINIQDRNQSHEAIPGVKLLGNVLTLENNNGEKHYAYEWEVS